MTLYIIFLDQDSTLADFDDEKTGLYPKVVPFLEREKGKERKLYIVTTGKEGGGELGSVNFLLDGYLGRESIALQQENLFILPDGTVRTVDNDYQIRFDCFSEDKQRIYNKELDAIVVERDECEPGSEQSLQLQQKLEQKCKFLRDLVHKKTGEMFDERTLYMNPHLKISGYAKDLYLARRLIAPVGYETLRTV